MYNVALLSILLVGSERASAFITGSGSLSLIPKIESQLFVAPTCLDADSASDESSSLSRRQLIVASMAGLTAEAAWRQAVDIAAFSIDESILPKGAIETIEAGKAVVIPNWLTPEETLALRKDNQECFQTGAFKNFVLSRNPSKADRAANDRWIMNSFSKRTGSDGPFVDPNIGNLAVRNNLKAKMAQVKAVLAKELQNRPTLSNDIQQTHEMEYLRYGTGAKLQRHTDEHHIELKVADGSRMSLKENASRRSITWMVYLNDEWDGTTDGGQLRFHERAEDSVAAVGARGPNLQVGWLKATKDQNEQPVFLDPLRPGPDKETCMLYTSDGQGVTRDLSQKPFANIALYLAGDALARKLMVENSADATRLHLIDAPKSLVSSIAGQGNEKGEDGGERIRDVVPKAGTLVMFDSVSLPHEVLQTNRERFGVQGWFHEKLYSAA